MKRLLLFVVFTLVMSTLLFAGGQQEGTATAEGDEPVELTFTVWSGFEGHLNMLNEIADAYKEENPNVSVNFTTIPFGEYVSKVTIQLAGSNPTDAGWLVESSAPAFVEVGALLDGRQQVE